MPQIKRKSRGRQIGTHLRQIGLIEYPIHEVIITVLFLHSEEFIRISTLLSEQHLGDANDEYVDASDEEDNDDNDEEEEQEDTEHWDNDLERKLENEKHKGIAETEDYYFQIPKILANLNNFYLILVTDDQMYIY